MVVTNIYYFSEILLTVKKIFQSYNKTVITQYCGKNHNNAIINYISDREVTVLNIGKELLH
jgi:hypothetical protein